MSVTIEQIEDAVVSALSPLRASLGVRTVATYQDELTEEGVSRLVVRLPAIYVVYGGSRYADHGARVIEIPKMVVLVIDRSLRDEAEVRRGGNHNPGTYAMLAGVRELLCGQQLDLDMHPLKIIRENPLSYGRGISIYAAEFETGVARLYPAA